MKTPTIEIKTESSILSTYEYQDISMDNVKLELKSEPEIIEIDETIFSRQSEYQSSNTYNCNDNSFYGDVIVTDEIIKEEPIYFNPDEDKSSSQQDNAEKSSQLQYEAQKSFQHLRDPKINYSASQLNKVQLKCPYCAATFAKKWSLQGHLKIHQQQLQVNHSPQKFECPDCHKKFNSKRSRNFHQRLHTNRKPYECYLCHKSFTQKFSLSLHQRLHTGVKTYKCNQCSLSFRLKLQLDRHLIAHMNGEELKETKSRIETLVDVKITENVPLDILFKAQNYECYLCSFGGHKNQVKIHMKIEHTGEEVFKCSICSRKLLSKHSMDQHMNLHLKKNAFKCHICTKHFARKDGLRIHLQSHTGDQPYQCTFCPMKFSKKYTLDTHVRIHSGFKPFVCEFCKKGFVKKSDLVRHARTHTGERPFKCAICRMTFTRHHHLIEHKLTVHRK